MALDIPRGLDINPFDCRWDPDDPHSCFDDTSCGCYFSPCDFFDIKDPNCGVDTSELCCSEVQNC